MFASCDVQRPDEIDTFILLGTNLFNNRKHTVNGRIPKNLVPARFERETRRHKGRQATGVPQGATSVRELWPRDNSSAACRLARGHPK
jgi:hypothetical protein